MADVIERITHDHREVEQMFTEFERTKGRELTLKICDEMTAHTVAEDKAVYPLLEHEAEQAS